MRSLIALVFCGLLAVCGCKKQNPVMVEQGKPYNPFTEQPPPPQNKVAPPVVEEQPPPVQKLEGTYTGTWVTTNRKLDGTMKCVVTDLGGRKWKGQFDGVWQGQYFKYNVDWEGMPSALKGKAVIDGASYDWEGQMTETSFRATFGGSRYKGYFDLKK